MKQLKSLLVAGAITLSSSVFSQYFVDNPALIEMDAKRKEKTINVGAMGVDTLNQSNSSTRRAGAQSLEGELDNYSEGRNLFLFYRNDEHALNKNDSIDLTKYFEDLSDEKIHYFQVRGYADINGKNEYNYDLALRRANEVANMLKQEYPLVPIEIISIGESGSSKNLEKNRKVEVIPNKPSFYTDLNSSDAKYFLLDLSGSMKDKLEGTTVPKYLFLREVKFPADANIFGFFSGRIPKCDTLPHLDSFMPKGSSHIYGSAKNLVDKVVDINEDLHIFTDGKSTDKSYCVDDVISSALKKNVEVSIIGVDIPKYAVPDFMRLASETGGDYSICEKK